MSDNVSSLDLAIEQVDKVFQSTNTTREQLIGRLATVINSMSMSPDEDSPLKLDAKLHVFQTLQALLKDKESSVITAAKVKMQKKDTESSDAARQIAIELLKNINVSAKAAPVGKTIIPTNIDSKIDAAIGATHKDIADTELEGNTSSDEEQKE